MLFSCSALKPFRVRFAWFLPPILWDGGSILGLGACVLARLVCGGRWDRVSEDPELVGKRLPPAAPASTTDRQTDAGDTQSSSKLMLRPSGP